MKILRIIFVIAVLCAPFYAQQVNQDIVPASPGLYLGHTNQRWNGYFNNADIYNLTINGSPIGTGGIGLPQISIPNGTNCTTLNGLVEFDGNGQAQTASLSSTKVIGVAVSGAGCSGNVLVQYAAIVNCTTDGSTLINDRIAASNSIAGDCMDIGPVSIPGIQTVGLVTVVSSGAGQLTGFDLFTGDTISPSSSSGSGVVSVSPCVGPFGYAATAAAIVSWDCNTSLDGSGNAGFKKVTVTGSGAGKIDFGTSTTPGNPSVGFFRLYADSGTGFLTCLNSSGGTCLSSPVPTGVAKGSALVSNGVSNPPIYQTKLTLDARDAGMVCDDSTDDTTAMNAALTTLFNAGGGTLVIPAGVLCKIAGQITIPRNGVSPLNQTNSIHITSAGGPFKMWGSISPAFTNWGALDMQFNAANGKIVTQGLGYFEIDHISLTDNASDCATFIYDTLSTVNIHDVYFRGTHSATTACNDPIILGGTDTSTNNTITSAFNGYGSTITNNFFAQSRAIKLFSFANSIQITNNTWDTDCGGSSDAAIESTGVVSNVDSGNIITGNLIELTNYQYGIWLKNYSQSFYMAANQMFDVGTSTAGYRFETNSVFNLVIDSASAAPVKFSDATGTNTFITSEQSVASIIPQPWTHTNVITEKGGDAQTAYDIFNTGDNSEAYWQVTSGVNATVNLNFKPTGQATASSVIKFIRQSGATSENIDLGMAGDGGVLLRTISGADLRLETQNSGNVVFICGGTANCKNNINASGQLANSVSTGTAPFTIASTTAVPNLTVQNCNNCAFTGTPPSTTSGPVSGSWNCVNVTPVTVNTNTAADQNMMACTIPAGTLNTASKTLRVYAAGVYSTPSLSTSQMTMKAKLCTVSGCGSGTVITPISIQSTALGTVQITNDNFSLHSDVTTQTTGASSAYEAHGEFLIDLSTVTTAADSSFGDTNTATVGTIDATGQLFVQITFAFSNASGSNSATQRQLIVDTVN